MEQPGTLKRAQQTPKESDILFQRITHLRNKAAEAKTESTARSNARRQRTRKLVKELQKKKQHQDIEEQTIREEQKEEVQLAFRREALGGLVVQVPEKLDLHRVQSDPYSPRHPTYYVSEIVKNYRDRQSVAREHIEASLQYLKSLEKSKMPTKEDIEKRKLHLPKRPDCLHLKTVVFDLDQTLIHCNESLLLPHDLKICIRFENGEVIEAGINVRPGAIQLLSALQSKFEVMIFTASQSAYANEILKHLDPRGELIHHRLYREHCHVSAEGCFVKDLRILGRPLRDVLLVDNAAYSYAYQLQNGVPILPYFSGKDDFELPALGRYLFGLQGESELRSPNHRVFQLNRYLQFVGRAEELVEQLYL